MNNKIDLYFDTDNNNILSKMKPIYGIDELLNCGTITYGDKVYFIDYKDKDKIINFNKLSESDKFKSKKNEIEFFKNQFQNLSETEIDKKLKEDLVPEAIEALKILKTNLTAKSTK